MKLFMGLGNPGMEYQHTRHNAGFLCIDALAKKHAITLGAKRSLEAQCGEGLINDQRVLLCKPQTFMNASGRTLQKILASYPITPKDVLVIYDDADLAFGDVRLKATGSSAGHRGMQALLDVLPPKTDLARLRIGIGRPTNSDVPLDEFVLQKWTQEEEEKLPEILNRAIDSFFP